LAITKGKKNELIEGYAELVGKSQAVIIAQYGGMNVPQLNKVRAQLRDAKAEFHITKNTLIARSFKDAGYTVPAEWLQGSTAIGFCFGDPPAVAKLLGQLSKEIDKLKIVGGVVGGQAIDPAGVTELALLPSLDVLRAQLIAAISAPASNLVGVLNAAVGSVMYALQARIDKEQPAEGGEPVAVPASA
jgi:large subunit ribosomal protein L10